MKSCHMQQWPRLIYQTQLIFVSSRTTAQAPDRHQVPLLHHRPLVPPCCRIRPDLRCVPFFRKSRVRMLASAVLCRSSAGTLCGAGRGPDHFWPSGAAALWCPRQTVLFFFGGVRSGVRSPKLWVLSLGPLTKSREDTVVSPKGGSYIWTILDPRMYIDI